MTTFQDLPPQSRRAVRQSERDGDAHAAVTSAPLNLAQTFLPTPDAEQSGQQAPPPTGRRSRVAPQSGLVDMPTSQTDGVTPEPLTYVTQGAPGSQQPVPGQPAPPQPFTGQPGSAQPGAAQPGSAQPGSAQPGSAQPNAAQPNAAQPNAAQPNSNSAHETGEQPSYRVRDFSPEARRAASGTAPQPAAVPLDYRTQAAPLPVPAPMPAGSSSTDSSPADRSSNQSSAETPSPTTAQPPVAAERAAAPAAPVQPAPAAAPLGPPMSRRELRAREAEALAASGTFSGVFAVPELVEPVVTPPSNLSNAMAEFEALTRTAQPEVADQPTAASASVSASSSTADQQIANDDSQQHDAQQHDADSQAREAQAREAQSREPQSREAQDREAQDREAQAREAQANIAEQQAQVQAAQAAHEQAAREAEQQRARDAALAAQATAQAEANARAAADEREQAELLAERKREYEAEQAERAREAQAPANPFEALFAAPAAAAPAVSPAELNVPFVAPEIEQTGSHAASTGHWSRQAEIDDETQSIENTLSREVGMGNVATTTSALVLPIIPQDSDFGSVLNGTGEVLITGSIDLPRSLSSTGGDARRYDDPDVDNLFDAFDNEIISTDSAPVRAIRAVSTHTSTHGVVTAATKPRGNRLLVGVAIGAVVLAIAVVGLLVFVVSTLN